MKLQCSCGAKYAFDVTPEMLQNPVTFVCPTCGMDSSDFVNELIRQKYAGQTPPVAAPAASRLKIAQEETPAEQSPETPAASPFCSRHRSERTTEKCAVCQKPICPKCLELFGYFCSPLCKGKAEAQNIDVPVFAGRKDVVESQFWHKTGLILGAAGIVILLALGGWTWYAWYGSVPHSYFSVRFADTDRAYFGRSQLVGQDQIVFLHGGTLARYDLKTKKQIWSQELVTQQQIDDAIKAENDLQAQPNQRFSGGYSTRPSGEEIERLVKQRLQAGLSLHVSGQNIWVGKTELSLRVSNQNFWADTKNTLTHYDWDSGKVLNEITLPERGGELVENGDELLMLGAQSVTHINLASGDFRDEQFGAPGATLLASVPNSPGGGLPGAGAGADAGQPLDPQKVEAQAQNLKLPARIALPALLANAQHEQQLEAALRDDPQHPRPINSRPPAAAASRFQLVSGENGFAQISTRLLEAHLVARSAMKAPPAKSVLNGDLTASKTTEVANEILNDMQRNAGGDTVMEDESRYQVTVHLPGSTGASDWTGEVVGPPQLFVLKTVNVIAAGKTLIILDKANKKLWQAALTYSVAGGGGGFIREESQFGEGPCVEHDDTLYVFDQAVLTAFELNSGNARWRLPSVGIVGLFFDDKDNVYVNTTTGNPDDIKYSRQIDISRKTEAVLFKIDSKTGKTLWRIRPGGYISYLSGKFIYTIESYDPNPSDEEPKIAMVADLQKPPYLHLSRIRPSDGHILWDHYQDRCPIDVRFNQNSIELIFKREVQVLRYLTL